MGAIRYNTFKFHYDSINSVYVFIKYSSKLTFKFHYDSINSYSRDHAPYSVEYWFKFHYDSINSDILEEVKQEMCEFKFHYDSINSQKKRVTSANLTHLNSIMILLIRASLGCSTGFWSEFKFHYDSINSLFLSLYYTYHNSI